MSKGINDLRDTLFATLERVKDGTIDLDNARQVNDIAKTIIDTAKVEIEYLRVAGPRESEFMTRDSTTPSKDSLPNGITSVVQHRLQG